LRGDLVNALNTIYKDNSTHSISIKFIMLISYRNGVVILFPLLGFVISMVIVYRIHIEIECKVQTIPMICGIMLVT